MLALMALMTASLKAQECKINVKADNNSGVEKFGIAVITDQTSKLEVDTIILKNGKAKCTIPLTEQQTGIFFLLSKTGRASRMTQIVPLMPNETLEVTVTGEKLRFSGSDFYKQGGEVRNLMIEMEENYLKNLRQIESDRETLKQKGDTVGDKLLSEQAYTLYQKYQQESQQIVLDYAKNNPNNEGVVMALPYIRRKVDVVNYLSPEVVKNSRVSKSLQEILEVDAQQKERERQVQESKKSIAEGKMAPDFTLKDINGNDLTLSSLQGKYVVLDFWGSWCGWCIKGFPKMKEYYAKYSSKMEILGIDCNDSEEKWANSVKEHQLPWKHVYNPRNGNVPQTYAIQGFPTKIVVDPEGKIAKIVIGESEEFYTYLDNLFN